MAINQSKKILDKINGLFQHYSGNQHLSSLERDLMLGYIRDLYEAMLEPETEASALTGNDQPMPAPTIPQELPRPVIEQAEVKTEQQVPIVPQPAPIPEPEPIRVEIPIPAPVIEASTAPLNSAVKATKPTEAETANDDFQAILESIRKQAAQPEKTEQRPLIKPSGGRVDNNELFEERSGTELSDKLGGMPIDDLKKGMSLNERIIFLNELFDGNKNEFDNALHALNVADGFENAKKQLVILATRFEWATKEKQAKIFIKLVKRRHSG